MTERHPSHRTRRGFAAVAATGAIAAAIMACSDDTAPIAVLVEAGSDTEKATADAPWSKAAVGARFYFGDAVKTNADPARLSLSQSLGMRVHPGSIIRFGGKGADSGLLVEVGVADLEGQGELLLGDGKIKLDGQARLKLTAGNRLELTVGTATIERGGQVVELAQGTVLDIGTLTPEPMAIDAAPAGDAAIDAPDVDAAPSAPTPTVALVISGKKADFLPEGETEWMKIPAGKRELPGGTTLRLGSKTTAKATFEGLTLELPPQTTLKIGGDPFLATSKGRITAAQAARTSATLAVPGGRLAFDGGSDGSSAVVDVSPSRTRIAVTRGGLDVVGKNKVELLRGESAVLLKNGTIDVVEEIPKYHDLIVSAGSSLTIHDPSPSTAVRFGFPQCKASGGGSVELARDKYFRAPRTSGGDDAANLKVPIGSWFYRIKCDGKGKPVASGRIAVRRDDGRRRLPTTKPPTNFVEADGYKYRVYYQNLMPSIQFTWRNGSAQKLVLNKGGSRKEFPGASPLTIDGKNLTEGNWTFWFEGAGDKRSETSFLKILFDNATPSAYIEEPVDAKPWGAQIAVTGATLPGWSVKVEGAEVDTKDGRFATTIGPPASNALSIQLSHPKRGVHVYLRRQR